MLSLTFRQPRSSTPRRAFIVGCPRSGTTFLQAALSSHPEILSMPETAFFERTMPGRVAREISGLDREVARHGRQRGREYLRIRRRARRSLRQVADELGIPAPKIGLRLGLAGYVDAFANLLDAAARARDCGAWLEKTPSHVFYLDVIERYVADARFIHLLRRGEDVVASAVDASLLYTGVGDGRSAFCQGIPWWVGYWNAAIATHRKYVGRHNHCIVFYEDLVRDFAGEYQRLCEFIGVAPVRARLDAAERVARLDSEPWKQGALSGRLIPATPKFEALFGPAARDWIRDQLCPYDEVRALLRRRSTPVEASEA